MGSLFYLLLTYVCSTEIVASSNDCMIYDRTSTDCFNESLPISLNNFTVINFNSSFLFLHENRTYHYIQDVTLKGIYSGNGTTIVCKNTAGLLFDSVNNLTLSKLNIQNCSFSATSLEGDAIFTGIFIINSKDISIINVSVKNSTGLGMIISNTYGKINISDSIFEGNIFKSRTVQRGGGGIYIDFSQNEHDQSNSMTFYAIENCKFLGNQAAEKSYRPHINCSKPRVGRGGGMGILLRGHSKNISIMINHSIFYANTGVWGGGLSITLCQHVQHSTITIFNSTFNSNKGELGGGGLNLVVKQKVLSKYSNSFYAHMVTFEKNSGMYGGGAVVYSDYNSSNIEFRDCFFQSNDGTFGSALDISRITNSLFAELPVVLFKSCNFTENGNRRVKQSINKGFFERERGTVLISSFKVIFGGDTKFIRNNNSAIHAVLSGIQFEDDSHTVFEGNHGQTGGALILMGSLVQLNFSASLIFRNNCGDFYAGAIYVEIIDLHNFLDYNHESCFIHSISQLDYPQNTLHFEGNKVISSGSITNMSNDIIEQSIYATSIEPCLRSCSEKENINRTLMLRCIGEFTFLDSNSLASDITELLVSDVSSLEVIPGFAFSLPLVASDVRNISIRTVMFASICQHSSDSSVFIEGHDILYTDQMMQLNGRPGDMVILCFTAEGLRGLTVSLQVTMLHCPALFRLNNQKECACKGTAYYKGAYQCHGSSVFLSIGYWVGYDGPDNEENLLISYCPNNFCNIGLAASENNMNHVILPKEASSQQIDSLLCNHSGRTGITCSKCREGHSVYFHSEFFFCGPNHLCRWGFLFYFLSELVPISIFFIIVIIFNISFTSGSLNGFIFFAQVSDLTSDLGESVVYFPYRNTQVLYKLVYRTFNFDFFSINALSFCLLRNAQTLDIIVLKYVSVVYGLFLISCTILLLKYCNLCICCHRLKKKISNSSMLHGLTTFFVLVYSQCTKVAFQLLNPGYLYHYDQFNRSVVFLQGDVRYLSKAHLPYIFPALISVLLINYPLPFLLLMYPLSNRVITSLKLNKVPVVRWMYRKVSIAKLKPLLDSFQGSFKDNFRFFSGLYFFYRIIVLATRSGRHFLDVYIVLQVIFTLMLFIHLMVRPYEKKQHNIVDALLFLNLAVINSLDIIRHTYSSQRIVNQTKVNIASWIQIVLLYIPVACLVFKLVMLLTCKIWTWSKGQKHSLLRPITHNEVFLPHDMSERSIELSGRSRYATESYQLVKEKRMKMFTSP